MAENTVKGTIPCALIGGPLDGAKYGDLPDLGGPYTGAELSVPLGQPADEHPHALYRCEGDAPVDGLWQFFYVRTGGLAEQRTCEGFDAGESVTMDLQSIV